MTDRHWFAPSTAERLSWDEGIRRLATARVACLGETHDRADIHIWQRDVLAALHALRPEMVVGFEMFPRRVQPALDDWVAGMLTEAGFLEAAEWSSVWGFDPELYLPLFRLCRERGVPMRASNVNRPLVSRIGREGWEAVPTAEREGLSPAAPASPDYRAYLFRITGGARPDRAAKSAQDPAFDRFVRAQQVWDRAFACSFAEAANGAGRPLVVGIVGQGHVAFGGGTPSQLRDLGLDKVQVALAADADTPTPPGCADLVWRLRSS